MRLLIVFLGLALDLQKTQISYARSLAGRDDATQMRDEASCLAREITTYVQCLTGRVRGCDFAASVQKPASETGLLSPPITCSG